MCVSWKLVLIGSSSTLNVSSSILDLACVHTGRVLTEELSLASSNWLLSSSTWLWQCWSSSCSWEIFCRFPFRLLRQRCISTRSSREASSLGSLESDRWAKAGLIKQHSIVRNVLFHSKYLHLLHKDKRTHAVKIIRGTIMIPVYLWKIPFFLLIFFNPKSTQESDSGWSQSLFRSKAITPCFTADSYIVICSFKSARSSFRVNKIKKI